MWRKIASELFSRYIFIVDIVIIVVFAAFIAAAADQVISSRIDKALLKLKETKSATHGTSSTAKPAKKLPATAGSGFSPVDGKVILARNFFDSETGPLDEAQDQFGGAGQAGLSQGPTAEEMSSLPPKCVAQIKIVGLFASPDPQWSFAAVESGAKAQVVGVGQTIQGYVVSEITWKYLFLASPGGGAPCYLDIWQEELPKGLKGMPPGVSTLGERVEPTHPGLEDQKNFQALLNNSITDVSETEKNIDKSFIDYLVQNKGMLMQSGRILPNIENEEINGFKVYGIRKSSLWGKLGIQNGDVIHSVNGINFTGPDAALEAFTKLQGTDHMTVNVTRRGQDMNIDYNVK
jgi:general secretion pathway protein C